MFDILGSETALTLFLAWTVAATGYLCGQGLWPTALKLVPLMIISIVLLLTSVKLKGGDNE